MVLVDVHVYVRGHLAACVEGWMNHRGGSQVAAQIIMLQRDVTTSKSLNLTASMNKSASDVLILGFPVTNMTEHDKNCCRGYTVHRTSMCHMQIFCVQHALQLSDFSF